MSESVTPEGRGDSDSVVGRVDAPPDHRYLHSIEETAIVLSISRARVYHLINAGYLTRLKLGRRSLIADREIRALIDALIGSPRLLERF